MVAWVTPPMVVKAPVASRASTKVTARAMAKATSSTAMVAVHLDTRVTTSSSTVVPAAKVSKVASKDSRASPLASSSTEHQHSLAGTPLFPEEEHPSTSDQRHMARKEN